MIFNIKVELDETWIDEYYGNLSKEFSEMLYEEIKASMRKVIKEELKADELTLAAECRKVIAGLGLKMNAVEIADLAYALVDTTLAKAKT